MNEEQKKPQAEKLDDDRLDQIAGGVETTGQTASYTDDIIRLIVNYDPGYGNEIHKG